MSIKFRLTLVGFLSLTVSTFASVHTPATSSPDDALAQLKEGNARFASSAFSTGKSNAAKRAETAQTQHPFAIILACADSRTAPELVFDQSIGDLFVIRTAGSLVEDYALGSIEYAVEHLGTRLIVVLGHERCGAVTAAMASDSAPGHLGALVRDIQPAVKAAKGKSGDPLANTVTENVRLIAAKIQKEAHLGEHAKSVRIIPAVYDLDTGKIEWSTAPADRAGH